MRHRAAERADEQDAAHAHPPGQFEDAVAERAPAQVRLLAEKQHQIGRLVAVENVGRHVDGLDQAVFDLDAGAEQGGELHRAGEVVDVERLRSRSRRPGGRSSRSTSRRTVPVDTSPPSIQPVKASTSVALVERGTVVDAQGVDFGFRHPGIVAGKGDAPQRRPLAIDDIGLCARRRP